MNWKNYVEKQNERTFVMPEGWDSRATVADNLGCSEERVDEVLRPGIKSGEIEKQQFRVWQGDLKRIITVVAYRKRQEAAEGVAACGWTDEQKERVVALKKSGKTWAEIAPEVGHSPESVRKVFQRAV